MRRTTVEDVAPAPVQAGAEVAAPGAARAVWRSRSRWVVHLGLLAVLAASLATLQLLHVRVAYHADMGLAFAGLVLVHLAQRRLRISRMVARLRRTRLPVGRELRLLASDAVLLFLTANVVVSGVVDWGRPSPVGLPFPPPLGRWHAMSAVALVAYLIVHVVRRRRRILRSTIR